MDTALFDYALRDSFIAQQPAEPRDSSRLMVLERKTGALQHLRFREIDQFLQSGDLLVANDSRVIPARLHGHKPTGGAVELLLLRQVDEAGCEWVGLTRGKGLQAGSRVLLGADEAAPEAEIVAVEQNGARRLRFSAPIRPYLDLLGEIPLPPYITAYSGDRERYQTVYSRFEGSAAAPTAGLHFTPDLLIDLRRKGVELETVTLHIGLDTFKPVEAAQVEDHQIHTEWAELSAATARRINDAALHGGRVVAVGTTTVRTLEWGATHAQGIDPWLQPEACPWKRVAAFSDDVRLYIRPGYRFRAVDALITNFHLPRSSLLLLVSAFIAQAHGDDLDAGRRILLESYAEAQRLGYRFFSFGDAMLIV
jgi:S-adenosylmethionine:tRNA ribosyltransferase-isomerase